MRMRRGGPGLIGAAARTAVIAGTAGRVAHRQQRKFAEKDAAAAAQAQPEAAAPEAAAPAAASGQPDYVAELQELAKLRDAGILTPEEFEAKKAQILGI